MMYKIVHFQEEHRLSYQNFVEKNFGKEAYQKNESYLEWLYFSNPYNKGWKDFLLVVYKNTQVVGCIHKLSFELFSKTRANTAPERFSVIHNLMVDKKHRKGCGFLLLREILKTEKNFIVPGVLGPLSVTYKNIGARTLPASWWKKSILPNPFALLKRARNLNTENNFIKESFEQLSDSLLNIHFGCPDFLINHLEESSYFFEKNDSLFASFLNWRFLQNNEHGMFVLEDGIDCSFLIAVVGKRKNLPVTRVIYTHFLDAGAQLRLARGIINLSKKVGSLLVLLTSSQDLNATGFNITGFKQNTASPDSYLYSKTVNPGEIDFWPLVSDLGFEELFGR